ncbi:MAG: hypothetical protein IIT39_16965 [Clostridia bacterium]|nr:hypothetical protein [Clostridia bacterium]
MYLSSSHPRLIHSGCTALIDAIGEAVEHISTIHKYARPEDIPEHTVFVITTDGMENASKKFSSKQVKKMIEEKKNENNWEFLFIGANIDAVETASHFGIDSSRAVNYHADKKGTGILYESVSNAIGKMRACAAPNAKISDDWAEEINEDYNNRKNNK